MSKVHEVARVLVDHMHSEIVKRNIKDPSIMRTHLEQQLQTLYKALPITQKQRYRNSFRRFLSVSGFNPPVHSGFDTTSKTRL